VTTAKIAPSGTNSQVLVTDATTGAVTWIDQADLGNTATADNGLTKTDNNIQLGGNLIQPTTITTGVDADGSTPNVANTLAIKGLEAGNAANRIVVQDATTGVLQNVVRSISFNLSNGEHDVATLL